MFGKIERTVVEISTAERFGGNIAARDDPRLPLRHGQRSGMNLFSIFYRSSHKDAAFQDRDGHGPQFQAHMNRINAATGANITVSSSDQSEGTSSRFSFIQCLSFQIYHNFNAEVAYHRQHWWRCRGPCRDRAPYFGYVKRATNRAPGPNDTWHQEHQLTCGGEFEKIKEPEGYSSKKTSKTAAASSDIGAQSSQGASKATKKKKLDPDDKFPGQGHVLGDGSSGKMRRLEDYFPPTAKPVTATATVNDQAPVEDDARRSACPVCQAAIDSEKINDHLDECLTKSMLNEEAGTSA